MSLKLNELFSSSKNENQQKILIVLTIALVTLLCFANTLLGEFVFDDQIVVKENPNINNLSNIFHLFLQSYWGENNPNGLYRPLTNVSYALNFAISGLNTYGYHLVNIIIHIVNSLLIYWICEHYTKIRPLSLLTALFFSIHPVHSEAVATIYSRPELLATMFLLIAWWFYVKSNASSLYYILSLVSYFLSLLCKESGLVFVGILFLVHICHESSWATRLKPSPKLLGYIFATIPYLILRVLVTKVLGAPKTGQVLGGENLLTRVFTMSYGYAKYFLMLVWPAKLYTEYDFTIIPKITSFSLPVLIYLTLIFGAITIALWQLNRKPLIAFAILFFFVTTSIVSNILIPTGILIAERAIYLSLLTICLILAAILYRLYQLGWEKTAIALSIVILLAGSIRTYYRNFDFQNNLSLFSSMARLAPNHSKAFTALATEYELINELDKAESCYKKALEVSVTQGLTYAAFGNFYLKQGRYDEASVILTKAQAVLPNDPYVLIANGHLYVQKKEYKKAAEYLLLATKYAIPNAKLEHELGLALYSAGDLEQAYFRIKKATEMDPTFAEAYVNLARVLQKQNRYDEASTALNKAISLDPNDADAYNLYGANLLAQNKLCEAKSYLQKSIVINGQLAEAHYNLGLVYSQMGHFTEARSTLLTAISLNPKLEDARTELNELKEKALKSVTPIDCPN